MNLWRSDDGFALPGAIVISLVITFMLITVTVSVTANLQTATRAEQTTQARALAEAALDDVYARMLNRQVGIRAVAGAQGYFDDRTPATSAIVDCLSLDTAATCLGQHPAMYTAAGNAPAAATQWQYFAPDGALRPCPDLVTACFYLKHAVSSIDAGGSFDADNRLGRSRQLLVQVTVRANCRGEASRCQFLRFQQTLQERRFTDYLSLTQREVIDPQISQFTGFTTSPANCPEWPEGAAAPPAAGFDPATYSAGPLAVPNADVRAAYATTFAGCLKVPYTGFASFSCIGADGCEAAASELSLDLAGGAQGVALPNSGIFVNATTDFSVEAWISPVNTSSGAPREVIYKEGNGTTGIVIYTENRVLYATIYDPVFGVINLQSGLLDGQVGQPRHVAVTYKATGTDAGARLWLDGQEVNSSASPGVGLSAHSGSHSIGRNSGTGVFRDGSSTTAWPFTGRVDEVARYNQALSASQVAARYDARDQSPQTYSNLVLSGSPGAYYRFNDPSGTVASNTATGGVSLNGTYLSTPARTPPALAGTGSTDRALISVDTADGPVHTNDRFLYVCGAGRPTFTDVVESASGTVRGTGVGECPEIPAQATFTLPGQPRVGPQLELPQSGSQVQALAVTYRTLAGGQVAGGWAYGTGPSCNVDSEILVRLAGTQVIVTSACDGITNQTRPLPPSGVLYVRGTLKIRDDVASTCPGRSGSGLSGRLTVVGHGNVHIDGPVTYCSDSVPTDSVLASTVTDLLGVVALPWTNGELHAMTNDCTTPTAACTNLSTANTTGAIRIYNTSVPAADGGPPEAVAPPYSDVIIQGVLAAPNRTVYVDRWNNQTLRRTPPSLRLQGAVTTKYRPIYSSFEDARFITGVVKDIRYDPRLRTTQPPYMLQPTVGSWTRVALVEVPAEASGL